jgi:catechol 2,3-dioxygenase-like lactoylglutathione lyase family enzyme
MIHAIDHIVILVNDLDRAAADYASLGFTVVPGGEHTGGASHNALIAFADGSYLELIAFRREVPEHRWWRHLAAGEGLIEYALLPSAIAEDVAAAVARGLPLDGPSPGGRVRPDGAQIAWQIAWAATSDVPFLCADVTPRELRVPGGTACEHANGAQGIAGLTVAVEELDASLRRYQALLGIEPLLQNPDSIPEARTAAFIVGDVSIGLAEPLGGFPFAELLRDRLQTHGEGIFALALRTGRNQPEPVDPGLAHGARIVLA